MLISADRYNGGDLYCSGLKLNIVIGFTGMFSLDTALLRMVHSSPPAGAQIGLVVLGVHARGRSFCRVLGAMIGLATLRLRAIFLAFTTPGFGEIVRILILNWTPLTRGHGLVGIPVHQIIRPEFNSMHSYYLILVLIVIVVVFIHRLSTSKSDAPFWPFVKMNSPPKAWGSTSLL